MSLHYGFDSLPHFRRPAATVGSYDGVHAGHGALLRAVREEAERRGGESIVLSFDPHPRVTLGRAEGLQLLTTVEEKALLLERATPAASTACAPKPDCTWCGSPNTPPKRGAR